jgi:hypothetical protein
MSNFFKYHKNIKQIQAKVDILEKLALSARIYFIVSNFKMCFKIQIGSGTGTYGKAVFGINSFGSKHSNAGSHGAFSPNNPVSK